MTAGGSAIASGSNVVTCAGTLTTGHFTSLVATAITCAAGYGTTSNFNGCWPCFTGSSTYTGLLSCTITLSGSVATPSALTCSSGYFAASYAAAAIGSPCVLCNS